MNKHESQPEKRDGWKGKRIPFAWENESTTVIIETHKSRGIGDAGTVVPSTALPIEAKDQTKKVDSGSGKLKIGDKATDETTNRLLNKDGEIFLTTRDEETARGAIKTGKRKKKETKRVQEATGNAEKSVSAVDPKIEPAAEEKTKLLKEQGQALVNLLTNVIESRKLAREGRYLRKHKDKEAKNQAWLKEQEAKTKEAAQRIKIEMAEREKKWADEDAAAAAKAEKNASKKIRVPRWMVPILIGLAALAAGGYFFPTCEGNNTKVIPAAPTSTPETTPIVTFLEIEVGSGQKVKATNVDSKISDSAVDVAHGQFTNTIGGGTEAFIASPGGLLVGPDFGSESTNNLAGWQKMYDSQGAIQPFSSVTQDILRYQGPAFQNLPEGGFALGTWTQAKVTIDNVTIDMPAVANNNYIFIARGTYGDNQQNTDKNKSMEISEYLPGFAQVLMYGASSSTNTAFISEGQFKEIAMTSHSGGTNGGDGGNSRLTVVMYDANSKAFSIIQQDKGRFENTNTSWRSLFSNFSVKAAK